MHTYQKVTSDDKKITYQVGYYTQGEFAPSFNIIRTFEHEIQAIAFTNYLNGGTNDITLIKELIEQA